MKHSVFFLSFLLSSVLLSCSALTRTTPSQTTGTPSSTVQTASNVVSKIDNLLDLYEQYVGRYITAYRNFRNGDQLTKLSAASEAAQLLNNANGVNSQLEGLKNQMSSSQVARWGNLASQLAQTVKNFQTESGK